MPRRSLTLLIVLAAGCVPEFNDDLSVVRAPRIAAVQAEPAEAKPGESVTLRALILDADPLAAPAPARFALCIDRKPLTELGPVSPACIADPSTESAALVALGAGEQVTATLPAEACRLFGPSRPEPKDGEPAGRAVDPDPTGGYFQPVTVAAEGARDLAVGAVRLTCALPAVTQAQAVEFTQRYRPNQNPEVATLTLERASEALELLPDPAPDAPDTVRVAAGESVTLRAAWRECPVVATCGDGICGSGEDRASCGEDCTKPRGCVGAEHYAWFDPASRQVLTRRESIVVSWFATSGSFRTARTVRDEADLATFSDNVWLAPSESGTVRLWAVIGDGRGGQSWRHYRVLVAR